MVKKIVCDKARSNFKTFTMEDITFYNSKNDMLLLIQVIIHYDVIEKNYYVNGSLTRHSVKFKYKYNNHGTKLENCNRYYYPISERICLEKRISATKTKYYIHEIPKNRKTPKTTEISVQEFFMHKIKTL